MADKEQYIIRVKGKLVEVTPEVYFTYYRMKRQEEWQEEKKKDHNVISYDALDTEDFVGLEAIPDTDSLDVEEIVSERDLKERLLQAKRMESGNFITQKYPFGYRLVEGKLVIDEKEAATVRKIFHLYLSGWSTVEIAAEINKMEIPTRDGLNSWSCATVKYILQNEKYIGDALLQKKYSTVFKYHSTIYPVSRTLREQKGQNFLKYSLKF